MDGVELQDLLRTLLPDEVLLEVATATGFHQRDRKRDALTFLRTMLVSASSPSGGRQADMMRQYFEAGAPKIARGSFYDWFGPALEKATAELAQIALSFARAQEVDLPGVLGGVRDWRIVDSTTVKLHPALQAVYPGAGDYAAVKVHKTVSVGCGTVVDYHFSPAREHDSTHLTIDESWRGMGLLVDLGYASFERLRRCQEFGVKVVVRLKDNWKPKVTRVARADLKKTFVPGTDLDLFLDDVFLEVGNVIDVDVTLGVDALPMRLVGVLAPTKGHRFYLTNLPRSVGPHSVADLYRVRWEVESSNKLDKSNLRLDEIDAQRPAAVNALLHASMTASVLIGSIVHRHNLAHRPATGPRNEAPLHHRLVALMVAQCAYRIACAFHLEGEAAAREWEHLAAVIVHMGKDPNWRSKPSILDQLRGWKASPSSKSKLSRRRAL
jgi:hypothetical protein